MRCPYCLNPTTSVIDSRAPDLGSVIRRRRMCPVCRRRFTTYERASFEMPKIIKRQGYLVDYDRMKIFTSMATALSKRPVSVDKIDDAADAVEFAIRHTGERQIKSSVVGRFVLEELRKLDIIAYIRFASVYFNVKDPQAFIDMIQKAVDENQTPEEFFDESAPKSAGRRRRKAEE